jgi:hypothetical protein
MTGARLVKIEGRDASSQLMKHWLRQGWKFRARTNSRLRTHRDEYLARMDMELELIESKDFVDYFLVTSDIVRFAKDKKIPVGSGRGSAAASLICYLLRITELDPLQFKNMDFFRFLDPSRMDMPDIDLDFSDDRRSEIFEYAEQKYGKDKVAHIANFTRYRGKNSLDDVARVYRIPKWEIDIVKDLVTDLPDGDPRQFLTLRDAFSTYPQAAEVLKRRPQLKYAMELEKNYRNMAVHAAGLVLSYSPISNTCAVYEKTNAAGETFRVVAYDKKDAEHVGMLKLDILGLSTMGMIGIALDEIGMDLEDLYALPLDDKKTLRAFRQGDVTGIFQFEGRTTRLICQEVRPSTFLHLADINALSRPGPLFSGMKTQYVNVRNGTQELESIHPLMDEITGWTYNTIPYQEQIMAIFREIGGFPGERVNGVRKIMGKKEGGAQFAQLFDEFAQGAKDLHGMKPETARRIWRMMENSSAYLFNFAHSASYAHLAYLCVAGTTRIYDWDEESYTTVAGAMKKDNIRIACYDEKTGKTVPGKVKKIYTSGRKDIFTVRTESYKKLRCTMDHPILTPSGYKKLSKLKVGDLVAVEKRHSSSARPEVRAKIKASVTDHWAGISKEDRTERVRPAFESAAINIDQRWSKMDEEAKAAAGLRGMTYLAKRRGFPVAGECGQLCFGANELPMCAWLTENGIAHEHQAYVGNGRYADFKAKGTFIESSQYTGTKKKRYEDQYKDELYQSVTVSNFKNELSWMLEEQHMRNGDEIIFEEITAIDFWRFQETYDIEMEGPNHNFLANGVVVHNCMWLKQNHPTAFFAAQLAKVGDGKDKLEKRQRLMLDAMRGNPTLRRAPQVILPPDILTSERTWSTKHQPKNTIRAGFVQIPKVGAKTAENIAQWRDEQGGYAGADDAWRPLEWTDMAKSVPDGGVYRVGAVTVENMLKFVTADDPFELERTADLFTRLRTEILVPGNEFGMPVPTHTSVNMPKDRNQDGIIWAGVVKKRVQRDYVADQRSRFGKTREEVLADMKDPHLTKSATLYCYDDFDELSVKFNRYEFAKFQEAIESIEVGLDVVVITGKKLKDYGTSLYAKNIHILSLDDEDTESEEE